MLALHANERLLGTHRKTWVVFALTGTVSTALFFAPLALLPVASAALASTALLPQIPGDLLFLLLVLWWWGVWIGSFTAFTIYYLDVFILTSERIIRVEQISPFRRTVSELRLERVQDVTVEQHGILPTLLHFGNVRVQTAGESAEFSFTAIPHPLRIKESIMAAHRDAILRARRNGVPESSISTT